MTAQQNVMTDAEFKAWEESLRQEQRKTRPNLGGVITRGEWDVLNAIDRHNWIKTGGRVKD